VTSIGSVLRVNLVGNKKRREIFSPFSSFTPTMNSSATGCRAFATVRFVPLRSSMRASANLPIRERAEEGGTRSLCYFLS